MLKLLTEQLDKPDATLADKDMGQDEVCKAKRDLLIKMEQEIEVEIEELRKNWSEVISM